MAFFVIYILEAHASDGWQMPINLKESVVLASPRSFDERTAVADSCVKNLRIEIPALIDDFHNSTEIAYTGWPDRLYVIDRQGRIAFKSRPGPYGFKPAEVDESLKHLGPQQR